MYALSILAAALLVLTGLVLLATGVLGLTRRLPGNNFLGVRTPETRKSPEAWGLANRAAGPGFVGAGVMAIASAAGLLLIGGPIGWLVLVLAVVVAVGTLGYTGLAGARAAAMWQAAQPEEGCGCGPDGCGGTHNADGAEASEAGAAGSQDPSTDCGITGGCGTCQLKGMCESEPADAVGRAADRRS